MPIMIYHEEVLDDVRSIPVNIRERIKSAIEGRIAVDPLKYGEPLRRSLAGHRKMRVGDYRVVYQIFGEEIRIWTIDHRKKVYSIMERRKRKPFRASQDKKKK